VGLVSPHTLPHTAGEGEEGTEREKTRGFQRAGRETVVDGKR